MRVAIVMPAYCEGDVLGGFLGGLLHAFQDQDTTIIVVDDCSPDDTAAVASGVLGATSGAHRVVRMSRNVGHGPATLAALRCGLESSADVIVAVDGDAQFHPADVRRVVDIASATGAHIVEGVRMARVEPRYRTWVSWMTRNLIHLRSGRRPADANTPLRVYCPAVLARLLSAIRPDCPVPNLVISALSRTGGIRVVEVPVASLMRPAAEPSVSWGNSLSKSLPSRRFLAFCVSAALSWLPRWG